MFFILGFMALSSIVAAAYILYRLKFKHKIEVTKRIPGPPALPIIGHGHFLIGKPPHELILMYAKLAEVYGPTFKLWIGPELNINMHEVKDVEAVLGSMRFTDKAGEYKKLKPWLQEGLLVSGGSKWQIRRKIITPAFHFKILDQFVEVFERESRMLIVNMEAESKMQSDQGFNLYEWINLCALDTICGK